MDLSWSAASVNQDTAARFEPARFIPQGKFYTIPESKLVVNRANVILNDALSGSDFSCHLGVL